MAQGVQILLFVLVSLLAGAHAQTIVELRTSARLDGGVRLADVATIEGPDARAIGAVVLADDVGALLGDRAWHAFSVEDVREAVEAVAATRGIGLVTYRGRACSVGLADRGPLVDATKPAAARVDRAGNLGAKATIGEAVIDKIARTLGVVREDLRASFREQDHAILAREMMGRTVTVVPLGVSASMPVRVRVYELSGAITEDTVRATIEVRRPVVRATRRIERGERIPFDAIATDRVWVRPDTSAAPGASVPGAESRRAILAGEVVTAQDIERPLLVGRGELTRIHCVTPSLVVEYVGRALGDGRLGETVEFEIVRGQKGRVSATVRGAGRAVIEGMEGVGG